MNQVSEKVSIMLSDSALKGRAEYRRAFQSLRRLQSAYGQFVPKNLIDYLGADDITEISLGDEVEMNLTVMFSDIRNFTALSEDMTSKQTFKFINSYLAQMEAPIRRHSGVVDKFIGDAIMALFTRSTDDAVFAAISMMETLEDYNATREELGRDRIEIGIGLNTGLATLGVIGNSERMETTVIGDCVNVASRMEGLTKTYRTPVLISEDTLVALENPMRFCTRFIDRVLVKGRHRPISVYEVFNADAEHLIDKKLCGLEIFEKAVALYHMRDIDAALPMLEKYVDAIPEDRVAQIYLQRCRQYRDKGIYEGIGELTDTLDWQEHFNTGDRVVDADHQMLNLKFNELSQALFDDNDEDVHSIVKFLENYVVEHFGHEEELMVQCQYPFLEDHVAEHDKFIRRMGAVKEELLVETRDPMLSLFRVNLFLYDWLISHSTRVDKHLVTYAQEKNISLEQMGHAVPKVA